MYNIDPMLWGGHLWRSLHYISLSYPENPDNDTKLMFKDFFTNIIWKYLPCEKCRYNYQRHLIDLPLTDKILESRNNFIFWLVDIHNIVNEETGKKKITYKDFNDIYMEDNGNRDNYVSLYVTIFLIIVLIILFIIYKKT